jgi:hypothetical protein
MQPRADLLTGGIQEIRRRRHRTGFARRHTPAAAGEGRREGVEKKG